MIGDLFDSPWKILIVAVVIIVLFGSKKLPGAARSLGQSMRILKREVSDLHHEEEPDSAQAKGSAPEFPQARLAPAPAARPRTSRARSTPCSSRSATSSGPRPWTPRPAPVRRLSRSGPQPS